MTEPGSTCDADTCDRRATQVGTVPLPVQSLELRLCDAHVDALRAGKLRGLSLVRTYRGRGWTRPAVSFDE